MKPTLAAVLMVWATTAALADIQSDDPLQMARGLERALAEAVLAADVDKLDQLWANELKLNNPVNQIVGKDAVLERFRSGAIRYEGYAQDIDSILVHPGLVIVMGLETVTPVGASPYSGQRIIRRYTNIWKELDGRWQMIARQASVVCD